jgi:thiol-disulfide isomerase/thioredoxin
MTSGLAPAFRENWMERLCTQLPDFPNRPLTHIAFPGSHDSGTATLSGDSALSGSCPAVARFFAKLPWIGPHCVKPFVAEWSRTQSSIIAEQVQQGIRYLDLRICHCLTCEQPSKDFDLCHAMRGEKLLPALNAVAQFIEKHPREIFFLDFNHFYEVGTNSDQLLIEVIQDTIGKYLFPYDKSKPLSDVTPSQMWELKRPILLCYHNDSVTSTHDQFWPGDTIVSPWINTPNPVTLIDALNTNLKCHLLDDSLFVSQCILSPQVATFVKDLFCCHCCPCMHITEKLTGMAREARDAYLPWMNSSEIAQQGKIKYTITHTTLSVLVELKNVMTTDI